MKYPIPPFFRLAALGALALGALLLSACSTATTAGTEASLSTEIGQVSQVTYVDTYETTGALAARTRTSVAWATTGTIGEVSVALGQAVKAGDVLMAIDPASVADSLEAVETEIENAQAALETLMAPDVATVTAAQKSLASAIATWREGRASLTTQLKRYASAGDYDLYLDWYDADEALSEAMNGLNLVSASLDVQMAFQAGRAAALWQASDAQAQAALLASPEDAALKRRAAEVRGALSSAEAEAGARRAVLSEEDQANLAALLEALAGYDTALNTYVASFDDDTAFEYAAKISSLVAAFQDAGVKLDSATLSLYALLREPDAEQYSAAVQRLAEAEEKLAEMQDALTLRAPVDGEVIAVNFEAGDEAKSNSPAVELIDRRSLYLTLSIEESQVIKLGVGDPVELSIEVMPNVQLSGAVAYINPVGTSSQGVVYYTVRVDINQPAEDILIGATANVAIQLGEPRDVLVVPVLAVQNDDAGEYVYRVVGDQYERVSVVSGLILEDDTVMVEGDLQVGDTVAIFSTSSSDEAQTELRVPGMGGGAIRP
jgi:HlyD family secretion protein